MKHVTPPPLNRGRESSIPAETITEMSTLAAKDWTTDEKVYPDKKVATREANKMRTALKRNGAEKVNTRIWKDEKGWVYALKIAA